MRRTFLHITFVFFLIGTLFTSYGQETGKILRGKVIAPNTDVTGVTIQNLSSKRASITDFDGNFSIRAKIGDTLVFSAVQFKRRLLPITEVIYNSPFVQISMEEFVNELSEVTVQPFGLSGDITKDVNGLQLKKDVSAEALGLPNAHQKIPTQSQRKLYEATAGKFNVGMVLNPPIGALINEITGRAKMLRNRVKVDKKYARTQNVQNSIVDSLFLNELGVPKEKIDDFMYFCEIDEEFQQLVALGDQLKLWEYLIARGRLYRKNNGLE